jgi:hypothetical protein
MSAEVMKQLVRAFKGASNSSALFASISS